MLPAAARVYQAAPRAFHGHGPLASGSLAHTRRTGPLPPPPWARRRRDRVRRATAPGLLWRGDTGSSPATVAGTIRSLTSQFAEVAHRFVGGHSVYSPRGVRSDRPAPMRHSTHTLFREARPRKKGALHTGVRYHMSWEVGYAAEARPSHQGQGSGLSEGIDAGWRLPVQTCRARGIRHSQTRWKGIYR